MVGAALLAVPVIGAVVLGVEVLIAANGAKLPETEPYDLDGVVGPDRDGRTERMVWLGDSTAAGVGASSAETALPRAYAAGRDHPVDLTVLAVSGARVSDVVDEQLPRFPDREVDTVVISVGANDAVHLTRAGDFERRYRRVLDALPADADVVMLGVPDIGSVPRFAQPLRFVAGVRGGTIDAVIDDLADAPGRTYVDIAGETGPAFRRDPGTLFAADDYHPSDAGYELWLSAVTDAVARSDAEGGVPGEAGS